MKNIKNKARIVFERVNTIPFETLIGIFAALSGLLGLLHIGLPNDILRELLKTWQVVAFNISYLIAGMAMVIGIGAARADLEGFGLGLVAMNVAIRAVASVVLLGFDQLVISSIFFNLLVIGACIIRIISLARNEVIFKFKEDREEE